jgi:hypothetical protein
MLLSALSMLSRRGRPAGATLTRRRSFRPDLEALEDRLVPTHWAVTSAADNVNQQGMLRWAVAQAKSGDAIDIQTAQTIVLTHGELYLARDVTIDFAAFSAPGAQATISGDHLSRVFEVAPKAHVNLFDLDIIDGNGVANNPGGTKAADGEGGAILNQGTLALTRCALSDNGKSLDAFGNLLLSARDGGGISNNGVPGFFGTPAVGDLTLAGCDLTRNSAFNSGGGIDNFGGSVAVLQCDLERNSAGLGGGLANVGGIMVVADNSYLKYNDASGSGAGIESTGRDAKLFALDCTLAGNVAGNRGGGLALDNGTLLAIDCTFSDNHAQHGGGLSNLTWVLVLHCTFDDNGATLGGGIYNEGFATATVETSTLSNNTASSGGGIYNTFGGVLNLGFSLLVSNTPDNLQGAYNDLGGNTFI